MTTPEPVSPAPEGPRALLSPDGKLIAWRTGARHFQWRATDGYDRMPEDVADWLPLVPAVSPAPDTEALRQQVARMLIDVAHDFGHARSVMVDTAVAADALLKLVAEREAGLRADLGQTRAERDKFADLHRGEARTHDETIASLNAARAEVERLRGIETASAGLVELVKQCGGWPDTGLRSHFEQLQELRADVERLTAALARVSGARPIPDDAAERFDALLDVAGSLLAHLVTGERGHPGEPCIRTHWVPEKRYAQYVAAIQAARDWRDGPLAGLGATPTTGPAPAAADVRWGVRIDGTSVQMFDSEHEAREWMEWTAKRADQSTFEVVTRMATEWQPAAPQTPAEPTEDARVILCPTCGTYTAAVPGETCAHDGTVLRPAAREDTAPPDDYSDNLTAGFLRAPVGACSCQPTAAVIHVPGTYCGDAQYEELLEAVEAGAEDQSAAVHLVLNRLANPTPEEGQ